MVTLSGLHLASVVSNIGWLPFRVALFLYINLDLSLIKITHHRHVLLLECLDASETVGWLHSVGSGLPLHQAADLVADHLQLHDAGGGVNSQVSPCCYWFNLGLGLPCAILD